MEITRKIDVTVMVRDDVSTLCHEDCRYYDGEWSRCMLFSDRILTAWDDDKLCNDIARHPACLAAFGDGKAQDDKPTDALADLTRRMEALEYRCHYTGLTHRVCNDCNGTGYVTVISGGTTGCSCPSCHGTGRVEVAAHEIEQALMGFHSATNRTLKPGQVAVDAQQLLSIVNSTCKDSCQAFESVDDCRQCWVDSLRVGATAAIDAANKE